MKSRFLKGFALLSLIAALVLAGCGSQSNAQAGAVGKVSAITAVDSIETSGSLSADQLSGLTWGTSGTVAQVNVDVGQRVKAGEVLALLSESSVSSDILTAQANLATAKRDLQDLLDSQSSQATAQQAVANAQQAVSDAQKTYDSLNFPRASQALIDNTLAQINQAKDQVARAADRYRQVQRRLDGDPVKTEAQLALTNAQLNLDNLIAKYNWYVGDPTEIDAALAAANLAAANADLADAQRNWDTLKNGPDPVAVAAAQAKVAAAQALVDSMAIIAPFDGTILTVQTAAGNPVEKGSPALEMVNPQTIKVDALIDETAISSVAVGDEADVTLDLLPGVTLKGKVSVISAIGETVNGLVKYTVTIAVDPTDQPLRFGATANIILYTSAPHTTLAVPLSAIQSDTQGEYVVRVKADGATERITVESGELAGNLVTLTASAGLKEGDSVELNTASSSSGSSNGQGGPFQGGGPGGGF